VDKTLIVVDQDLNLGDNNPNVIDFDTYLKEYPKINEANTRIINLCDTQTYLSKGYYCSLLAEARNHKVLPSVKTINSLRNDALDGESMITSKKDLAQVSDADMNRAHWMFFGKVDHPALQKLANKVFNQYQAPILKIELSADSKSLTVRTERVAYAALNEEEKEHFLVRLNEFTNTVWRDSRKKQHRWEMAILVNPDETTPPSDKEAISRFIKAAAKQGIHAQALTIDQLQNISFYDALFIREATAIDHYTYRLAIQAENNGLVVIDDSQSILRCCNKVYLHDAFSYQKVPSLITEVVNEYSDATMDFLEHKFGYPLVLKMPEGSFSRGVFKVANRDELSTRLKELFVDSALVLAQEYLYTEYDWRIGVLNGRAIYACRYLMARNHWQIYNHVGKKSISGGFETLPTFEVPKSVLDAALKATRVVGKGLYGVDIKEVNHKAYVLEVNDNPSIDYKVEDAYLGDELYMQIMAEFQRRLEARGR